MDKNLLKIEKFYAQIKNSATFYSMNEKEIKVDFKEKQRAITPGQFVVLYDENAICLGGGIIDKSSNN